MPTRIEKKMQMKCHSLPQGQKRTCFTAVAVCCFFYTFRILHFAFVHLPFVHLEFDTWHFSNDVTDVWHQVVEGGTYDASCDIWSLGVCLFMMLTGNPPFDGETQKEIMDKVRQCQVDWANWNHGDDYKDARVCVQYV